MNILALYNITLDNVIGDVIGDVSDNIIGSIVVDATSDNLINYDDDK